MGEFEIFANRIKQLRESLNMTQTDFSKYIGVKQQTLSGYERGLMKPPLDAVTDIAKKCHVSIDWLCGLSEKKNNDDEIKTYADLAKLLLKLWDLDFAPSGFRLIANEINNSQKTLTEAGILTDDNEIYTIIRSIRKMRTVLIDGTISQDIYNTWYDGFLEKYNKPFPTWNSIGSDESIDPVD